MLVDFIAENEEFHDQIKTTLLTIDLTNGDVFHYLNFLAEGMVKACGY
ncbi:hypothetical protein [Tenacibaculum phage Larrie]|nr:hypothetical protein [Tenacibaculum phage Larrie]